MVSYQLWVIMMVQCRFTLSKKSIILVSDIDDGEVLLCVAAGVNMENLLPPFQFCCKPKTALKK